MDPMSILALGSGVGNLLGGLFSRGSADAAQEQYQQMLSQLLNEYGSVNAPELQSLMAQYITPENVYNYDTKLLADTAYQDIGVDPRIQEAQNKALQELSDRTSMGLTPTDMAAINDIRRQTDNQRQSALKQLEADASRRGMAGSGSDEVRRMMANDQALNQASQESDRLAAMNYEARQSALRDLGNFSGSMRNQDYSEKSNLARARDAQNQFNTQWLNQAAQDKARMAQSLEAERANMYNRQQDQNINAQQQYYNNQRQGFNDRANLVASQGKSNLDFAQNRAANTYNTFGGLGTAAAGGASMIWGDDKKKKNPYGTTA